MNELYHRLTAPLRTLPDFLILGAQRAGTTSLFEHLLQHPCIAAPTRKEIHFFDLSSRFSRGPFLYRSFFPYRCRRQVHRAILKGPLITGEATPYYLYHPSVPARVSSVLPHARLIIMLRNPIDRALSHYHHEVNNHREQRSLEEAIRAEETLMASEEVKMTADPSYYSYLHHRQSYLSRGIYWKQIERWFAQFPREHIFILKSEDYFENPGPIYEQIISFLRLPTRRTTCKQPANVGRYTDTLSTETRQYLNDYFRPHNQRLSAMLGRNIVWPERP